MEFNEDIDLLSEYAIFLEEILNNGNKKLSDMSIMEVVDERLNVASDYFSRRQMPRLSVVTEDLFDSKISFLPSSITPYVPLYPKGPYKYDDNSECAKNLFSVLNLNLIYAQMPIANHEDIIRKLSWVASNSNIVAIFGTYYYLGDVINKEFNNNLMNGFKRCLQAKGLDFKQYTKETSDKHFEIVMSKK